MDMGAQERREQRKVQLNETLSSEMSKRPVVKAKPGHASLIAPMMERLGSIVLLDPAPSSKDETTTGSLHAIDGIDVVTVLVPEEDICQFEVMKTCAREINHFGSRLKCAPQRRRMVSSFFIVCLCVPIQPCARFKP